MKFYALNTNGTYDSLIEVEINLISGLPRFSLIGLPDISLKEGVLRIKSALISQGYEWPRNKEVIVNLKPSQDKKWNQNVELAILICFLYVTKQINALNDFDEDDSLLVLGEIDLQGEVSLPTKMSHKDLSHWPYGIVSGYSLEPLLFNHYQLNNIGELKNSSLSFKKKVKVDSLIQRPHAKQAWKWTVEEAEFLSVVAYGRHSAWIAGAQGIGKTTLAHEVWRLLPAPNESEFLQIQKNSLERLTWRPKVVPHHTIPKISLLGGGSTPKHGEVTRAHLGVLILDEILEFKRECLEVLREAMQNHEVEVARLGKVLKWPTCFQAIATSNLCPCGKWSGQVGERQTCSRSLQNCNTYLNRMVGPVFDRFDIVWLKPKRKSINSSSYTYTSSAQILKKLEKAYDFRKKHFKQISIQEMPINEIQKTVEYEWLQHAYSFEGQSERRRQAFWKVARSLADLDLSLNISQRHLIKAYDWTCKGLSQLP